MLSGTRPMRSIDFLFGYIGEMEMAMNGGALPYV